MKTHSKIPSPRSNVAATFRFLVVLIGIFPIMLWWQALIPIVWWWVRWMECWLQHQDFYKPCLRVKESQKNSMHTWHIVPCVFFCYVVFSCNNLNKEVFILLRHYLSKNAAYFAAKIRRKRRVTKLIGYILTFSVFPFREKQNVKTNKNSFKNITYHLEYQNLLLSLRGKY